MPHAAVDRYGSLEQAPDGWRLRFVRTLPHPPQRVWRALTEPAELREWFPTSIEGERAAGAALVFSFPADQAPPFGGEMLVYDPPRVLELRWGPDRLRFELVATPTGTELTLLDTLEELGKAARDAAGWHVCLDTLGAALPARSVSDGAAPATWGDVHEHYVRTFGPAAATLGPPEGMTSSA